MKIFASIVVVAVCLAVSEADREIRITNKCPYNVWISPATNQPVQGGVISDIRNLGNGASFIYQIPTNGWAGRFWPKTGCDGSGQNCQTGQSVPPCLPTGCDPPAETKVEFFYPPVGDPKHVFYDISLVDGFSLPVEIVPSVQQGSCITTKCAVPLSECPSTENEVGDLKVSKGGKPAYCMSPCKKWNYPIVGLGKPENIQPGLDFCCPAGVTVEKCRRGRVVSTKYVALVHRTCPTAYSYSYDDLAGNHDCPNPVNFQVTFCP